MKLTFEKLKIYNFLSVHEAELELDNLGYVSILGVNNNTKDNAQSNGSGKSSIIESIVWCLTGETVRGTKDIVSNFADDGSYVELSFMVDKDRYKLRRSKDHIVYKTNLKIWVNDEDISGKGIRDSEKILSERLPDLSTELIGSVIILGQGLPQRFSNNTPAARKEILEQLSKSDFMIQELKSKVSGRLTILENKQRELEDTILSHAYASDLYKKQIDEFTEKLSNLKPVDDYKSKYEESLNEKKKAESELDNAKKELEENNQKLSDIDANIMSLIDEIDKTKTSLKEKYDEKISFEESMKTDIRYEITRLENEINKLSNIKDVCPTCGQKIPGVVKPDTTAQEEELKKKREEFERATEVVNNSRNASIEEYQNVVKPKEDLLNNLKNDKQHINDVIKSIVKPKIEAAENHLLFVNNNLSEIEKIIQTYETQKQTYESQITTNQDKIKEEDSKREIVEREKETLMVHIDYVKKMNQALIKDFRGILLQNVITYIDKKAKEYCKDIFDNEEISFALNGNNIEIKYLNKDYENLSGGEKQKIDLIIQFALRNMLCQHLNFDCNILCVDEVFDNLDYFGCQKVIDFISEKLSDISSIFIITHHNDLQIPVDKEIVVVKDESGVSTLQ